MDERKNITVNIVNAFTHNGSGGNPAGIVLDADALSAAEKQAVAASVGLSETAFVSRSSVAGFKLDFFTPTRQIAHCGHATIAAFSYLHQQGKFMPPPRTEPDSGGAYIPRQENQRPAGWWPRANDDREVGGDLAEGQCQGGNLCHSNQFRSCVRAQKLIHRAPTACGLTAGNEKEDQGTEKVKERAFHNHKVSRRLQKPLSSRGV